MRKDGYSAVKRVLKNCLVLLPLLLLVGPPALTGCSPSTETLAIGQKAPEIVGADIDGNELKLSDYLGKVIVLDFWGDW